jgi:hypothetical protein
MPRAFQHGAFCQISLAAAACRNGSRTPQQGAPAQHSLRLFAQVLRNYYFLQLFVKRFLKIFSCFFYAWFYARNLAQARVFQRFYSYYTNSCF